MLASIIDSIRALKVFKIIENLALVLIMLFILVPILWFLITAFKNPIDVYTLKVLFRPTWENFYKVLFDPHHFIRFLLNSSIISFATTLIALPAALMAAYSFSRFRIAGSKHILFWIISTQFMPPIAVVLPFYIVLRNMGLIDTRLAMIIVHLAMTLPFTVWLLKGYMDGIPVEIEEAALVDGCSRVQALRHVTLKLSIPGIAVAGIFSLILSWNEFLFALILTNKRAVTLPVGLVGLHGHEGIIWEGMAVAGILIMIPMFVLALFIQKHFVRGLTLGAIQ